MTRLAALDLGSNSFHLLVADTRPRGRIKRVTTRKKTIRLGEPVSRTGRLGSEAFGRAVEAFTTLVELADDEGADKVIAVGTEAKFASVFNHGLAQVDHVFGTGWVCTVVGFCGVPLTEQVHVVHAHSVQQLGQERARNSVATVHCDLDLASYWTR